MFDLQPPRHISTLPYGSVPIRSGLGLRSNGGLENLTENWAGDTIQVLDAATGEERRAHIFVTALGASNYTYAESRRTETLSDWIGAHANALADIGGAPKALYPGHSLYP